MGPAEQIEVLRRALAGRLPGVEAHLRMAPRPRTGWRPGELPGDAREGAGLVLLYPVAGRLHLLLTVRPDDLPQHAGQVSLPGGAREAGESIEAAALREAAEEVGLEGAGIEVLGCLTPLHIPVSGFVLHPVVAHLTLRPALSLSEREVARVLEVALEDLGKPAAIGVEERVLAGAAREVPFFDVEGERVWGATAMILAELLWLLGRPPDPWGATRV